MSYIYGIEDKKESDNLYISYIYSSLSNGTLAYPHQDPTSFPSVENIYNFNERTNIRILGLLYDGEDRRPFNQKIEINFEYVNTSNVIKSITIYTVDLSRYTRLVSNINFIVVINKDIMVKDIVSDSYKDIALFYFTLKQISGNNISNEVCARFRIY